MNTQNTNSLPTSEFAAYVGLDWGDQKHALAWTSDSAKSAPQTGTRVNSPEVLHAWLQELGQRFEGRPVALAVETSRGRTPYDEARYLKQLLARRSLHAIKLNP